MRRKYAPNTATVRSKNGGFFELPVLRYRSHPPDTHPQSPIKNKLTALELITAIGSAWWGFEHVYINSELRMVVSGFSERNELVMAWDTVPEDSI